jgi:nucleoside-diphosphate-sugar epimerase
MKTVLVTGSAGFIGGHLVDKLLSIGYRVIGVDDLSSGLQSTVDSHILSGNFVPKYYDIRSEKVEGVFREYRPEKVFHLAAIAGVVPSINEPAIANDVNINGTVNILNFARKYGCKKVVFSSSSSVYGGAASVPTAENEPLRPLSPYALQKKVGEEYCKLFSEVYDIDTVCLRYFNVFGSRQRADSAYAAVISSFCNNVKNNERPIIFGDGEQYRDFCPVENIVSANVLASEFSKPLFGEVFNVGCGEKTTVNQLSDLIGTKKPIYEKCRPGDVFGSQADIGKIKNILNYKIVMPFEDGIKNTVKWYLKE